MTNTVSNGHMNAADVEARMSLPDACDFFVKKVKQVAGVQEVFLVRDPEHFPIIWTIISAERFNFDARAPIYAIECDMLRIPHMPVLDFRILNLRETAADNLWDYLPAESSMSLWKREHASTI